jgi:hypothetical protein
VTLLIPLSRVQKNTVLWIKSPIKSAYEVVVNVLFIFVSFVNASSDSKLAKCKPSGLVGLLHHRDTA